MTSMRKIADEGLAYLIRICSYRNITSLVHQKEVMEELFLLINEIKAQALTAFWLTPSEIEVRACGDDYQISSNNDHREELVDTENSNAAEMELFLTNICQISSTKKLDKCSTNLWMVKYNSGLPKICIRKAEKCSIHIK